MNGQNKSGTRFTVVRPCTPLIPLPPFPSAVSAMLTMRWQRAAPFMRTPQLRRELGVPSVNASDVTRGLARLKDSGYLGSGPAHAWSSSEAISASSASATAAAAKRAVDLSLRKRGVHFDQLVPLLLDPAR